MMRAWVIGNGPSLAETPLDLLVGEVTYATNRIHLIYPKTVWRPTFYVYGEPFEGTGKNQELMADDLIHAFEIGLSCWMHESTRGVIGVKKLRRYMKRASENYYGSCEHNLLHFDSPDVPHEWHLPQVCAFGSSVNAAIQLAVKAGYGPIYLLGCDMGFTDGGYNHFSPVYERGESRKSEFYMNGDILWAHKIAFRCSPVPIYNCTLGGVLEVYPRKSMEEVLGIVPETDAEPLSPRRKVTRRRKPINTDA
jgi:hypothetical protein